MKTNPSVTLLALLLTAAAAILGSPEEAQAATGTNWFHITHLTTNHAVVAEIDSNSYSQPPFAVSGDNLFCSGNDSTLRLSASDLSGSSTLPRKYTSLASDLQSEKVYCLANGADQVNLYGGNATGLLEIDGVSGAPTARSITLSQPIPMSGAGIFSGYGRIVVYTTSGGKCRVYNIDLPSGTVTDYGVVGSLNIGYVSSAFWGVAEYFGNNLYLVYASNSGSIVRTRVPDGATEQIASFWGLNSSSSISFSPRRNRWYFDDPYGSEFNWGFQQAVGFADATWDQSDASVAPTISSIPNQLIPVGVPSQPIPFTITTADGSLGSLKVRATSSNQTLLPNANISLSTNGAAPTLSLTTAPNQTGTAQVTVTVSDGVGNSASTTFQATAEFFPKISAVASIVTNQTGTNVIVPFTVSDVETPASSLVVTAQSDNPSFIPNASLILGGSGTNRTLQIRVPSVQNMTAPITIVVRDATGAVVKRPFLFTMRPAGLPAAAQFRITTLTTNNAAAVDPAMIVGSSRHAIAVSSSRVFISGDEGIGTFGFATVDLSGGAPVQPSATYHGLCSNLRTETAYAAATDTGVISSDHDTITRLVQIDSATGALTTNVISLSKSITLSSGLGIFSGYDRVIIYASSHAYVIELPSGYVTDLGVVPPLEHNMQMSSHASYEYEMMYGTNEDSGEAFWGIAEYCGNTNYIVYVQGQHAIVRTALPTGMTMPLGIFDNLGNMDRVAFSPSRNRWYFDVTQPSQFGGSTSGVLGFADGSWDQATANSSPIISPIHDLHIPNNGPLTVPFWVGDAESVAAVTVSTTSNNENLVATAGLVLGGSGPARTLTITPTAGQTGRTQITLTARDSGGLTATTSFSLVVDPPAAQFRITSLSTNHVLAIPTASILGYYGGTLGVSTANALLTGSGSIARFAATNLSGGTNVVYEYREFVSNLRDQKLYYLASGTNLTVSDGMSVTALVEFDQTDGSPTGNIIPLSTAIPVNYSRGLFSGYDRVILYTGTDFSPGYTPRAYVIDLPSGNVTDLGAVNLGSYGWHNGFSLFSGVAEYFGYTNYIVYVKDSKTIVRTALPSGDTQPIASFRDLGAMSAISFSPSRNRWYFAIDGMSQFVDQGSSIGFADATWDQSTINTKPVISMIDNCGTYANVPAMVPFSVGDAETPLAITIAAVSGNTNLIPAASLEVKGSNSVRALKITPAANQTGVARITITVRDPAGLSASSSFNFYVVAAPPQFRVTSLTTNNAAVVNYSSVAESYSRAGLAISPSHVFLNGSYGSGRFSAADLSGGTALTTTNVMVAGNLRNSKIYSLASDTTLLGSYGGVATRLVELNGTNQTATASVIALSTPIYIGNYNVGLFSGYDRLVIYSGSQAYAIELPSGFVRDLGYASIYPNGYNSIISGVAEFSGTNTSLLYVQNSSMIMRVSLTGYSSQSIPAAFFSNLGDMGSIGFSPSRNRWYFYATYPTEFTNSDYALGYATATWDQSTTNTRPIISTIRDQKRGNTSPARIEFQVSDVESIDSLSITANSSNTALLPNTSIRVAGSGVGRALVISPQAGQTGSSSITVTVTDPQGLSATRTFQLTLTEPMTLSSISDQVINQNDTIYDIPFSISNADDPSTVYMSVVSSNPNILPGSEVYCGGYGSNRTVTVYAPTNGVGVVRVYLIAEDYNSGAKAITSFNVTAIRKPFSLTAYDSSWWGYELTPSYNGFIVEDFEDTALVPGLEVEISGCTNTFGPTNTLSATFDPWADDPNTSQNVFGYTVWDGSRVFINRRVPPGPPIGYDDFDWGTTTFHVQGGAKTFGFSVGQLEMDAALLVNGDYFTNLASLVTLGAGRNGYVLIQAAPETIINSVSIVNSNNAFTADGIAFDHVAFLTNQPPTVYLSSPDTTSFLAPGSFVLEATASDSDGIISRVEFLNGSGATVGIASNAPYQLVMTGVPAGSYEFTAVAYDEQNTPSSPSYSVYINVLSVEKVGSKEIYLPGDQSAASIQIAGGFGYIVGSHSLTNDPEGFIGRMSLNGNDSLSWSTNWPGAPGPDVFNALALGADGSLYAAGQSFSRSSDTQGGKDPKAVIVRYLPFGPVAAGINGSTWTKQVPPNSAYSVGGAEMLNSAVSVQEGTNLFIYVAGTAQSTLSSSGMFLSKLRPDGTVVWTVTDSDAVGATAMPVPSSAFAVASGGGFVYVAGETQSDGGPVAMLRKYDANGKLLWKAARDAGRFNGVTVFGGAIYAVGQTCTDLSQSDFLITKWDTLGHEIWSRTQDGSDGSQDLLKGVVGLGNKVYAVGASGWSTKRAVLLQIDTQTGDSTQYAAETYAYRAVNSLENLSNGLGYGESCLNSIATDGVDLYAAGFTYMSTDTDILLQKWTVEHTVAPLQITTSKLGFGELNRPYERQLLACGGIPPYSWAVASNSLPPGLSLSADGLLTGTPTATGSFTLVITASDSATPKQQTNATFSLPIVISNALPVVTVTSPVNGANYIAPSDVQVTASASDPDGSIDSIELYQDGWLIGTNSGGSISIPVTLYSAGTYTFTAVAYDNLGSSTTSDPVMIRMNEPGSTVVDFEAVNARLADVSGSSLANYLLAFGIRLTNEAPDTTIAVKNQNRVNGGQSARASSGVNFLTQSGSGQMSYVIAFTNPVSAFGFTRVRLLANLGAVTHPAWRATAYNSFGEEISTVGEEQISSYSNVPLEMFRLYGPDIAWVRIESDDLNFTQFHSPLLDDFTIVYSIDNAPPIVSLTSPTVDQTFTAPATVTLTATASDPDDAVSYINFYLGNYLVDSVGTSASASTMVQDLGPGTYYARAVAVDENGASRSSTAVRFVVNPKPGVKVINFDALSAVNGNVGGLALSNYLAANNVTISSSTPGTRLEAANTKNLASGRTVIPVSPENVFSQFGGEGPVTFTLRFASGQSSVRFTRPALHAGLQGVSHPRWKARAFDTNGVEVASVGEDLIRSSENVGQAEFDLAAPDILSVRFDSDNQGVASFSGLLIDDLILDSNPAPQPLQVSITSPANGASFSSPTNLTLTASATNELGGIDYVEFFAGPMYIDYATTPPYSVVWADVLPGTYVLRAKVVDLDGNARISAPVTVTVTGGVSGDTAFVNFDSLETLSGPVSGTALSNYLGVFGITISGVTAGTQVEADNQDNLYFGDVVESPSYPNLLTQTGSGSQMGFTLQFSNLLQQFTFMRAKLVAGASGVSHPAWQAVAYNALGNPVAVQSEDFIASFSDVDAKEFTLAGQGIASVRFDSWNSEYAAFPALLIDSFILERSGDNLAPAVSMTTPLDGAIFLSPATITLKANAIDPNDNVARVDFFAQDSRGSIRSIGRGIQSGNDFTFTWTNVTVGRYGVYAVATDTFGTNSASEVVQVQVQPKPTAFGIIDQPENLQLASGQTAAFAVTTTPSSLPISFSWRFTDFATFTNVLANATNATLVIANVTGTNAGFYYVVAKAGTNSVTSEAASLEVVEQPVIVEQPQGLTVSAGINVTFSVTAAGATPLTYQWLLNGNPIAGATGTNLTLRSVQPSDAGDYTVLVQNRIGVVESDTANLTVIVGNGSLASADSFTNRIPILPLLNPTMGNTCDASREDGEPLHAGKTGGKSIWYTWHATFTGVVSLSTRGSSFDTLLAVYTGTSLTNLVPIASDDDSAGHLNSRVRFNCIQGIDYQIAVDGFDGACGNVVLSIPPGGYRLLDGGNNESIPEITAQPASQTVLEGAPVTLSVAVRSLLPVSYQWFYNTSRIPGATNATVTIDSVNANSVGAYYVQVANEFGSVDSEVADVQIIDGDINDPNSISSDDKFGDARGNGITSSSFHSGKGSSVGASRGYTTTQIFNTARNSKEIGEPNHAGEAGGKSQWFAYQAPASGMLHINTDGSSFNTVLAVYTGDGLSFASLQLVAADKSNNGHGGDRVRFQATAGTLYFIAVDGVGGASGRVQLNINLGDGPVITSQPQTRFASVGGNATFTVGATGTTNLLYQWQFNGVNIPGATSTSYAKANVQSADYGAYRVVVSNAVNSATSAVAMLSGTQVPVINTQPASQVAPVGGIVRFSVDAAGSSPLVYRWRFNGTNLAGATSSTLTIGNVKTTSAGKYSVLVSNLVGRVVSSNATLTVSGVCSFSIIPASASFSSDGGSSSVSLTTLGGCPWRITNTAPWITLTSTNYGVGATVVTYNVAPNTNFVPRSAILTIAGKTHVVAQAAAFVPAAIAGKTVTMNIASGTGSFQTSGTTLFVASATNNTYRLVWIGSTNVEPGTYSAASGGRNVVVITTANATCMLTFTNATSGAFLVTNSVADQQTGSFLLLPTGPDYDLDCRTDLALQRTNLMLGAWLLQDTNLTASVFMNRSVPTGWRAAAIADFNRDDSPDLLLQSTTARLQLYLMEGTNYSTNAILGAATTFAGLTALSSGDFNYDGLPDILLKNSLAQLRVWTNGVNNTNSPYLRNGNAILALPTGWQVLGAGDFDGNNSADILLQNTTVSPATLMVWYFDGLKYFRGQYLFSGTTAPASSTVLTMPAGWRVAAIADLNSDGQLDLVLQNNTTRRVIVWYLNRAGQRIGTGYVNGTTGTNPGWYVLGPK